MDTLKVALLGTDEYPSIVWFLSKCIRLSAFQYASLIKCHIYCCLYDIWYRIYDL